MGDLFFFSKLKPQTFNTICDNIIPEKVHTKFCKYILGTNKFTSNDATRGELGRYPIATEIIVHSVKYWLSLKKYATRSLAYQSYLECFRLLKSNKSNWLSPLKQVLTEHGF